ncbi:Phosphoribulokinase / Uridine kinase family [Musa troglodytarum]|uniref:Phosphoribulokinase / Uridine kinase family n=1 Tax=Musa troglodytarum TaxID=320322 RepID=A0A9E7FFT7_9LILI|nr:Phosphoribulokinase / Uridine kinase family [Musa troglodytarum]
MEDEIIQRVLEGGGRDYYFSSASASPPSPTPSSSSILQSLPLHVSFDHGYYLLVKAVQELRDKKDGRIVTVGIGGPSGSGKTSLAEKVESVLGCVVISMENYRNGTDDGNDLDSIDFDALVRNLQDLMKGKDTEMPLFDFQEKRRIGMKHLKISSSGIVIVDGAYALHSTLRSLLDIRVAVVGGVHFSLLSKVRHDIGDSCSLDYLIDSIFPLFRKHIEPDLHHAQIRINNSFVSSFREPYYKLKCKSESPNGNSSYSIVGNEAETENFIEMYLRPPFTSEEAKINDWIKVRQCGIRYYLSLGDQRIVDKHFIIRPKAEFEVGRTTLGGLLALGYNVVVSYKRACTSFHNGQVLIALETIDTLNETFMVLKGTSRKVIGSEASHLGISGPWITKSYLEMILESKGVRRLNTPPPASTDLAARSQDRAIAVPRPIRVSADILPKLEDLTQPWTRSPTKSDMESVLPRWRLISDSSAFRGNLQLAPMPDSYDLDRGLLLSALLENNGFPVIVGIGGPSGSGKTSLAQKMANIVGCEVVSLESYYKSEQVKDFKYDEFSSLDLSLLSKNFDDIRKHHRAKVPCFDFEKSRRNGFKELQVSEDSGVVIFEGVYALHPDIRNSLDLWIAVVGGVHSHLIARVQRDKNRVGCSISQNDIMTTVFPMFQQHIEPHLVHAHVVRGKDVLMKFILMQLKIRNDFDPVLSPESSLFVLKSSKQVAYQDLLKVLDPGKVCSSVQNFIDVYLRLPGIHSNGQLMEGDCIRVRICEGRFALLIREPIREGNFIIQPKVDFDISVTTVAGLLKLGYQAVAYIEASALIYQDGKILIEVDHLQAAPCPFLQIKGTNKEVVSAAAFILSLDGTYTTKSYLQIIFESLPAFGKNSNGIHNQQAARLQELVEFIQSQAGSLNSEASTKENLPTDPIIEDLHSRIRRLERWHTINMVFWTILMSALVGYSLYQRKRR